VHTFCDLRRAAFGVPHRPRGEKPELSQGAERSHQGGRKAYALLCKVCNMGVRGSAFAGVR